MRIKLYDLFCILFIRLSWSHEPKIVLNGLIRVDSSCFLCLLFNYFFKKNYHSTLDRLIIELHNLLGEYLNLAIKVTSFDILTLVKSSRFLNFLSKSLYRSNDPGHMSLNIGLIFYCVVLVSWHKSRVWRVNTINSFSLSFLIHFFSNFIN